MDDDFINVLASDVIFTYFQDKLGMPYYLLIVGDNNSGNVSILLTFSWLGYRALILETSITPANMYNFGSQIEQGQHIIIEDELGTDTLEQPIYKMSNVSRTLSVITSGTHCLHEYMTMPVYRTRLESLQNSSHFSYTALNDVCY